MHSTAFDRAGLAMAAPLDLAIIVPTLNEQGNIAPLLGLLDESLKGYSWEVVFVDDGSTDGTPETVARIARERRDVRLIRRHGRRGLSSAVIEGMLSTAAPVVAVMDGDLQHDETILPQLYDAIVKGGADVAVGTRYVEGGSTGDWQAARVKASARATALAQKLLATELSDPMSGFFLVRQQLVLDNIGRLSNIGFKILLDIMVSCDTPPKVAEIPYRFRSRVSGESKLDAMVVVEYFMLILDKYIGRWIPPRLIFFGAIGMLGLAVHLLLLDLFLFVAGLPFGAAQALAVAITIAFNFNLNNQLTYRDRRLKGRAVWLGLASFYLVCGIGAIANVGASQLVYDFDRRWWLAGIAGAAISAVWNFAASSFLTWKRR